MLIKFRLKKNSASFAVAPAPCPFGILESWGNFLKVHKTLENLLMRCMCWLSRFCGAPRLRDPGLGCDKGKLACLQGSDTISPISFLCLRFSPPHCCWNFSQSLGLWPAHSCPHSCRPAIQGLGDRGRLLICWDTQIHGFLRACKS